MRQAQSFGPLTVPQGLVLCFANGKDYGPDSLIPNFFTATMGGQVPLNNLLMPQQYPIMFNFGGGAAGFLLVKN